MQLEGEHNTPRAPSRKVLLQLQENTIFASLRPEAFGEFVEGLSWRQLEAGELLFNEGDPGQDAYILLRGRLQVSVRDRRAEQETAVGVIQPGELVGEMALLSEGLRSATIRALRPCVLAELPRTSFFELLKQEPQITMALTRLQIERLQHTNRVREPRTGGMVLAVVPLCSLPPRIWKWFLKELMVALRRHGKASARRVDSTVNQDAESSSALESWLVKAEPHHRWCVLEVPSPTCPAGLLALDLADTFLFVGDAEVPPLPDALARLRTRKAYAGQQHMVLLREEETSLNGSGSWWYKESGIELLHQVRTNERRGIERVARFLCGEAIALVLSGGCARGAAHIGVLRALEEHKIPIDLVGGTSIGAVVGGLVAAGFPLVEIDKLFRREMFKRWHFDVTLPRSSILQGRSLARAFRRLYGDREIEDLALPFFATSNSLRTAEVIVHRHGLLRDAVHASGALAVVVPPFREGEDSLVDGILLSNLPVEQAWELTSCRTIAVNLLPQVDEMAFSEPPTEASLLGGLPRMLGWGGREPHLLDIAMRAAVLSSARAAREIAQEVDLFIEPPMGRFGFFELWNYDAMVACGYQAAVDILADHNPFAELC